MDFKQEIFKGKNFSDLLKDIYDNRNKKDEVIKILIDDIRPFVKSMGDATLLVPLLKEYVEIGVKNDEQLVKMASIVQRALSRTGSLSGEDSDFKLSDEEKEELLSLYKETEKKDEKKIKKDKKKFEDILDEET